MAVADDAIGDIDAVLPDPRDAEDVRATVERLRGLTLHQLEDMLGDGGKKRTVRVKCQGCGNTTSVELPAQDADTIIKAAAMLSTLEQRLQAKGDDVSTAAVRLIEDRNALSDVELAEYILRLRAELAASEA